MRALALLALALLTAVPAANGASYTYVAGGHEPTTGYSFMCSDSAVVVGGACLVDLADPTSFTVTVVDALGNPVWFQWFGQERSCTGTTLCGASGHSFGSVSLSFPADCLKVAVFPHFGTFAGTITIE